MVILRFSVGLDECSVVLEVLREYSGVIGSSTKILGPKDS